ncbi:chemotaxis protein CheD [Lacibacterium aquatile]|uniref:Probable chemoreceptor glutamine deamidase CheD n=1 Tax=Lacibacterium aquatile TaxID=1168082 RepID=A0ABW5DML9_9PROT
MIGIHENDTLAAVFLNQGEIYCTATPTVISTVLGSCISVCLWDGRRGIGGMNHYVLPEAKNRARSLRYGDVAVAALVQKMIDLGSVPEDIDAKIFGGASAIPSQSPAVGDGNIRVAMDVLEKAGISVAARSTGGHGGCVIHFHTISGEVLVRRLPPMAVAVAE